MVMSNFFLPSTGRALYRPDVMAQRVRLRDQLAIPPAHYATFVHPAAYVAPSVRIGHGSVVFAQSNIMSGVTIGCHVVINSGVSIEHDTEVSSPLLERSLGPSSNSVEERFLGWALRSERRWSSVTSPLWAWDQSYWNMCRIPHGSMESQPGCTLDSLRVPRDDGSLLPVECNKGQWGVPFAGQWGVPFAGKRLSGRASHFS